MRFHALLVILWLLCGCAQGSPFLAFPPTGSGDPAETAPETSNEEAVPNVLRTSLVARATRSDVWQITCTLRPALVIGGRQRPLDLHVDAKPCGQPSPNGIRANVDGNRGLLELEVPEGATPGDVREMQQGLADVSVELARRLMAIPGTTRDAPFTPIKESKRSTRWFIAAATVGGIGLVMLGVGGGLVASNDRGSRSVGEALMLSTALPLGVGAAVTAVVGLIVLARE